MYLNAATQLSYRPANNRGGLAACAKTRAQGVDRAVEKRFSLGEEVAPPTRAAEKVPHPAFQRNAAGWESVLASGPVTLILGWLSERLGVSKDAPATLPSATKSGPMF